MFADLALPPGLQASGAEGMVLIAQKDGTGPVVAAGRLRFSNSN